MSEARTSVQALIDLWPTLADFATDAGVELGTAKQMRRRSSIAPGYWANIVAGAQQRELVDVSFEALGRAHAKQPDEHAASTPEACS